MIKQFDIHLKPYPRGFHLITDQVEEALGELPDTGLLHLMIMHTSAGICINENADPTVREDFASFFDRLVPENLPYFKHTMEGPDDMPAHIKSAFTGHELSIPIRNGRLHLGTWQGVYLCEFRDRASARRISASLLC